MKYDILKCNNLRFRYKEIHGFVKVFTETICLVSDKCEITDDAHETRLVIGHYYGPECFNENISEDDFEIIPRDPNTYNDWQAGDKVCMRIFEDYEKSETVYNVAARINDVVILTNSWGVQKVATCEELSRLEAKLVLTGYELELQGEKNPDFKFRCGDRVLVRDHGRMWQFGIFSGYNEAGNRFKYKITGAYYEECLPYNEETWHLLGTSDDYELE